MIETAARRLRCRRPSDPPDVRRRRRRRVLAPHHQRARPERAARTRPAPRCPTWSPTSTPSTSPAPSRRSLPGRTLAITGVGADGAPVSEVATVKLIETGVGAGPRLRLEATPGQHLPPHQPACARQRGPGDARRQPRRDPRQRRPAGCVPVDDVAPEAADPRQPRRRRRARSRRSPSGWRACAGPRCPPSTARPPDARVYTTRRADDGTVTVTFGDGRTGARLPSGRDNVVATYRVGHRSGGGARPASGSRSRSPARSDCRTSSTRCPPPAPTTPRCSPRRAPTPRSPCAPSVASCRCSTTRISLAPSPASARRAPT